MEIEKYTYEVKSPLGEITLQIGRDVKPEKEYSVLNTVNIYGKNIGGVFANYVNCFIEIPKSVLDGKEYEHIKTIVKNGIEYKRFFCDNTIRELKEIVPSGLSYTNKYWPSRYDPILPKTQLLFDEIKLKKDIEFKDERIYWEVYADNAAKRSGEILISDLKIIEKQEIE